MLIGKGEFQTFPLIILCLTVPKQIVEEPFSVSLVSCIKKKLMLKRVMSRYYNEMFFSHSTENFSRTNLLCFTKCPVSKKFWIKEGGWEGRSITIFCQKILSDSARSFVEEPFCVSESLWYRKIQ